MKLENVVNSEMVNLIYEVLEHNCTSSANKIARLANIDKYMQDFFSGKDDGGMGKALECAVQPDYSKHVAVARENRPDRIVTINGKKCRVEVKTNGGRINNINTEYVLYGMDICNSNTKGIRRVVPLKLYRTVDFMQALETTNSIKTVRHNGIIDGYAIQVTHKEWYEFCKNYTSVI